MADGIPVFYFRELSQMLVWLVREIEACDRPLKKAELDLGKSKPFTVSILLQNGKIHYFFLRKQLGKVSRIDICKILRSLKVRQKLALQCSSVGLFSFLHSEGLSSNTSWLSYSFLFSFTNWSHGNLCWPAASYEKLCSGEWSTYCLPGRFPLRCSVFCPAQTQGLHECMKVFCALLLSSFMRKSFHIECPSELVCSHSLCCGSRCSIPI